MGVFSMLRCTRLHAPIILATCVTLASAAQSDRERPFYADDEPSCVIHEPSSVNILLGGEYFPISWETGWPEIIQADYSDQYGEKVDTSTCWYLSFDNRLIIVHFKYELYNECRTRWCIL